jgi:hypothetical protein
VRLGIGLLVLAGQCLALQSNSVVREGEHALVYYESGALSNQAMDEFSALLERGIGDIAKFAGITVPEQKISYFVNGRVDISRARRRSVYLPLERVRTRSAPYLHETAHVLLPCDECPVWLGEGYASFVQSYVSEHAGGYDGQIFTRRGNAGVDQDAVRWLGNERGKAMLPYVGTALQEPDLTDRRNAAAPFYVLAQSFVKFLVETTGLKDIHSLSALNDLPLLRERWLAGLKG